MKKMLMLMGLAAASWTALAADPALRFGLLPAESAIPLILAQEKGLFAAHGVAVELTMFQSPVDRNVLLQAGKLDGAIGDLMTVLAFREAGLNVTATSDINEDFKVLASPGSGVTSLTQLDGKDVSVVPNFALEYIMDRLAQRAGIAYKVINIPSIPARFEALLANRLTAVVFTEPQATLLAGRGAVVLGGSKAAGLKAGVLMFTDRAVADQSAALKAFYGAYNDAVAYVNGKPLSDYADVLKKYGFPDAIGTYLGSGVKYQPAAAIGPVMLADITEWTTKKGLTKKPWSLDQVATDRFVK